MKALIESYFNVLDKVTRGAECTLSGKKIEIDHAFQVFQGFAHKAHDAGNKLMFVGNGGSAGITSHMAVDFSKNGCLRSTAFNDGSMLTCLGNDLGYENVFAKQVEWNGREGDMLIAISSSGQSPNILNAANAGRACGCTVATFSGFKDDNPLRSLGDLNFYVRSGEYGFVELAHQALIHAMLDIDMGWNSEN